jgi:hypothetical protein
MPGANDPPPEAFRANDASGQDIELSRHMDRSGSFHSTGEGNLPVLWIHRGDREWRAWFRQPVENGKCAACGHDVK